jgi:hypothetical protein
MSPPLFAPIPSLLPLSTVLNPPETAITTVVGLYLRRTVGLSCTMDYTDVSSSPRVVIDNVSVSEPTLHPLVEKSRESLVLFSWFRFLWWLATVLCRVMCLDLVSQSCCITGIRHYQGWYRRRATAQVHLPVLVSRGEGVWWCVLGVDVMRAKRMSTSLS